MHSVVMRGQKNGNLYVLQWQNKLLGQQQFHHLQISIRTLPAFGICGFGHMGERG